MEELIGRILERITDRKDYLHTARMAAVSIVDFNKLELKAMELTFVELMIIEEYNKAKEGGE
jgi:hypothetical protein